MAAEAPPTITVTASPALSPALSPASPANEDVPFLSRIVKTFAQQAKFDHVEVNAQTFENSSRATDIVETLVKTTGRSRDDCVEIARSLLTNDVFWGRTTGGLPLFFDDPEHVYTIYSVIRNGSRQPQGVLVQYASCYSPTCTAERPCYSSSCPRRPVHVVTADDKALVIGTPVSRRSSSSSYREKTEPQSWVELVDPAIRQTCSKEEMHRQEVIFELIDKSEKEYLLDLTSWHDLIMEPISKRDDLIPDQNNRIIFVDKVFMNLKELLEIHRDMAVAFAQRQKEQPVISTVIDIYLKFVDRFKAYIPNSVGQMMAQRVFEQELKTNPTLKTFVDEQMRKPQCRRLKPDHFLSRPRWRVARYPMLLEAVEKASKKVSPTHPDIELCQKAMAESKKVLLVMNDETGKVENRTKIDDIMKLLANMDNFPMLELKDPGRQLLHSGALTVSSGAVAGTQQCFFYVFDNLLVMCRSASGGTYNVHRLARWDHLEVLEEWEGALNYPSAGHLIAGKTIARSNTLKHHQETIAPAMSMSSITASKEVTFALVFFGKTPKVYTIKATSVREKEQWVEVLSEHVRSVHRETLVYQPKLLDHFEALTSLPNCCVEIVHPMTGKKSLLVGTDDGLYLGAAPANKEALGTTTIGFARILPTPKVKQIELFAPEFRCIALLCGEKSEIATLSFDILNSDVPNAKREKAIPVSKSDGTSIIKISSGNDVLVGVKNKSNPVDTNVRLYVCKGKNCSGTETKDRLETKQKLMIGAHCMSIRLMNTSLIVSTTRGFVMTQITNGKVQDVVDGADEALRPLLSRQPQPRNMFRVGEEFLMCYKEFGLMVDKYGKRSKEFVFEWTGSPNSFALDEPYIIAFSERFIEVRHIPTSDLIQIIPIPPNPKNKNREANFTPAQRSFRHISQFTNFVSASPSPQNNNTPGPQIYITSPGTGDSAQMQMLVRVNETAPFQLAGRKLPAAAAHTNDND